MVAFFLIACQSTVIISEAELETVFSSLHQAVYDVYQQERTPQDLHQRLAGVFYGPLLTTEYVEHFTTQHHMALEETAIDIRQVDYNDLKLLDQDFGWALIDVDWSVGGVVTHQGHKHTRINRYRAVYRIEDIDMLGWRITDVKMRNAERIRRANDAELLAGEDAGGGYLDALDLIDAGMGPQNTDETDPIQENTNTEMDTAIEPVRTMKLDGFEGLE